MRLSPRRRSRMAPPLALLGGLLLAVAPILAGSAAAADSMWVANCTANIRATASTSGTLLDSIASGTTVIATGSVAGGSWSATCAGVNVSGSMWLAITTVGGKSTSTLYGKTVVYAATGLFKLAPPPPPPGTYLEGIDVSHWQGAIDWSGVAYAGKKFAIMKATEGTTYLDAKYAWNHAYARSYGLRVGAYHFANPSTTANDAVMEADWFVQNMAIKAGDLNPALDLETSGGLGPTALIQWVNAWVNEVYAKIGMRPMIYTSPAFWRSYMNDTSFFADHGTTVLWVAHWFVSSPSVPGNNWGGRGWTFWQYSDCGSVLGIGGCVDLDRFNGQDMTSVIYGANFTLASSPTSRSVEQGAGTSFGVQISRADFTLPIDLSVSGAPAGAVATLAATSTTGTSTTLNVTTSNSGTITPAGTYPLTITGTADGLTRTATATLVVTDASPPSVSAPSSRLLAPGQLGAGSAPGRTTWAASDASGISAYALETQVSGGTWTSVPLWSPTAVSLSPQWAFAVPTRYRLQATDGVGNVSAWAYGPTFSNYLTEQTATPIRYSSGWGTTLTPYASGGSLKYTSSSGASASLSFSGAGISWVSYLGPSRGSAKVYIDGVYAGTVNLNSSTYVAKQVVFARTWATNGTHTIKIVNLASSGHPRIDLDAFVRLVLS